MTFIIVLTHYTKSLDVFTTLTAKSLNQLIREGHELSNLVFDDV